MQIIQNTALITINETLVIQLLSFLIFLFVINRIMFKPLQSTMTERQDFMAELTREISEAEKEVRLVQEDIKIKNFEARKEASAIQMKLEQEAEKDAEGILSAISKDISDLMEKKQAEIRSQIDRVKEQITAEAETVAVHVMEKILERRLA